jgi:HD-GYP domain-containing protein (c-di-GMP phosphodiesterase class II)
MTEFRQEFRVSVRGLELGMFVSRLDRPWLDTPFLMQGFLISSDDELQKLQRICSHVYVDVELGGSPDPRFIELDSSDLMEASKVRDEFVQMRKTDWAIQTDFQSELGHAEVAHDVLQRGIEEVMEDLKSGRELDLGKLREGVDAMIDSITRNPSAFNWLKEIKRKDNYSYQHALGCSVWAASFGRHLGLEREDLRELALGGLLFDVGKTRLPPELLSKKQRLDDNEAKVMQRHVEYGVEMVTTHHERHNGTGYPRRLSGSDIPINGRIIGLIDSYDALTHMRTYAQGLSPHQAVAELYQSRGTLFQAELVEQFIQTCGIYPTGSLVELSNGQVGVVTAVHSLKRLRPSVMLLLDSDKLPLAQFRTIELGEVMEDSTGQPLGIKSGLPPRAYGIDPAELFLD